MTHGTPVAETWTTLVTWPAEMPHSANGTTATNGGYIVNGSCFFAVVAPGYEDGGFLDGAPGNLSDGSPSSAPGDRGSGDTEADRTITSDGQLPIQAPKSHGTHAVSFPPSGFEAIELAPFDETPDGSYVLAICPTGASSRCQCAFQAFTAAPHEMDGGTIDAGGGRSATGGTTGAGGAIGAGGMTGSGGAPCLDAGAAPQPHATGGSGGAPCVDGGAGGTTRGAGGATHGTDGSGGAPCTAGAAADGISALSRPPHRSTTELSRSIGHRRTDHSSGLVTASKFSAVAANLAGCAQSSSAESALYRPRHARC